MSGGYTADGRQRRVSRTVHGTRADAEAARAQLARDMGRTAALGDGMTLDEYYWGHFSPTRWATTTRANAKTYDSIYRNHIAGPLGRVALLELDNLAVQAWVSGLPPQSAPAYLRALRAIVNQASFDHALLDNPFSGYSYRLPRGRRSAPGAVWGPWEVGECLRRLAGDPLYPLWLVMAGAGLGRSEALALDREGVRWDGRPGGEWAAVLRVEGAFTPEDGMKEPKNDRRWRGVPLGALFATPLRACLGGAGRGPLAVGPDGGRMKPAYATRRWRRAFEEGGPLEGLPFVPLNRMRATYSTLMQRAGADETLINAAQGRSERSGVLYSYYLNPSTDAIAEAGARMERLVSRAM